MGVVGNAQAIGLLEYWLAQARDGKISYVALAAVQGREQIAYDYAGVFGCEPWAQQALHTLDMELEAIQLARKCGKRNLDLSASCVEWPLSGVCPHNWDFLVWLIDAEMTRRRLGGPAPLRVGFSKRSLLEQRHVRFFESVMEPLVGVVGAVIDEKAIGGRHKQLYVPSDIVVRSRAGEEVPRIDILPKAKEFVASCLHGIEPVTITLREAEHVPYRNSNLAAWAKFAREIEDAGEHVIVVRDTAKAMEPLGGLNTIPAA